jgi:hypothetical protein
MHLSLSASMRLHAYVALENVRCHHVEGRSTSSICSDDAVDFHSNRTMCMIVILEIWYVLCRGWVFARGSRAAALHSRMNDVSAI